LGQARWRNDIGTAQGDKTAGTPSNIAPANQRCPETTGGPVELNRGDRSTCALGQTTRVSSSEILNYRYAGTIRWESALPVRQVSKSPPSDGFFDQYVLSLRGLPICEGVSAKGESTASDAAIESIRRTSTLTLQNWMRRRSPVPAQTAQMAGNALLLGFPHGALHLAEADGEVEFRTVIKAAIVAAKFKLRPMIFRGTLAL
jgi:hypothetical protein